MLAFFCGILLIAILAFLISRWYIRISYDKSSKMCRVISSIYAKFGLKYSNEVVKGASVVEDFKDAVISYNSENDKNGFYYDYFLTHFGRMPDIKNESFISALVINKSGKGRLDYPKYRMFDWFDVFTVCKKQSVLDINFVAILSNRFNSDYICENKNVINIKNKDYVVCSDCSLSEDNINNIQNVLSKWITMLNSNIKQMSTNLDARHGAFPKENNVLYVSNNKACSSIFLDVDFLDSFRNADDYNKGEQYKYCEDQIQRATLIFNS